MAERYIFNKSMNMYIRKSEEKNTKIPWHPEQDHHYHGYSDAEIGHARKAAVEARDHFGEQARQQERGGEPSTRFRASEEKYAKQLDALLAIKQYRDKVGKGRGLAGMPSWYLDKYGHSTSKSLRPEFRKLHRSLQQELSLKKGIGDVWNRFKVATGLKKQSADKHERMGDPLHHHNDENLRWNIELAQKNKAPTRRQWELHAGAAKNQQDSHMYFKDLAKRSQEILAMRKKIGVRIGGGKLDSSFRPDADGESQRNGTAFDSHTGPLWYLQRYGHVASSPLQRLHGRYAKYWKDKVQEFSQNPNSIITVDAYEGRPYTETVRPSMKEVTPYESERQKASREMRPARPVAEGKNMTIDGKWHNWRQAGATGDFNNATNRRIATVPMAGQTDAYQPRRARSRLTSIPRLERSMNAANDPVKENVWVPRPERPQNKKILKKNEYPMNNDGSKMSKKDFEEWKKRSLEVHDRMSRHQLMERYKRNKGE